MERDLLIAKAEWLLDEGKLEAYQEAHSKKLKGSPSMLLDGSPKSHQVMTEAENGKLFAILLDKGHSSPEAMSVKRFYHLLDVYEQKAKVNKNGKN